MDAQKIRSLRTLREAEGYYELELFDAALEVLATLPSCGPHIPAMFALRGEVLRSAERYGEGADAFEKLISAMPGSVEGHIGLGWCRKRQGRLDLAVRAMESLLDARPDEPIGLYNLACYCALAGERDRALRLLSRAVSGDPGYKAMAREEADFAGLSDDPEFRRLTESASDSTS